MPRPGLPPTPVSSTEIRGRDQAETIDDFSLPPAALQTVIQPDNTFAAFGDAVGDGETSPVGTKRKRRDPSMNVDSQALAQAAGGESTFSLPPPPSRSRKIIQVQPEDAKGSSSKSSGGQGKKKGETGKTGGTSGTKSTAASRKTARKTAHSIIERRRRSKMNDEFETLKEMVPAARGQNMHKLAILQAGIEYVRYLEECIDGLKGAQTNASNVRTTTRHVSADGGAADDSDQPSQDMEEDEDDDDNNNDEAVNDEDEDMDEQELDERQNAVTPRASRPASAQPGQGDAPSSTTSPAIQPLHGMHSHSSSSSYAISIGSPSPAILPSYNSSYSATATSSTLPSPALGPSDPKAFYGGFGSGQITPIMSSSEYHALQAHAKKTLAYHGEADHEVIATLTMMGTERRRSQEEKDRTDGTRGMSVRDLLSG